MEEKEMKNKFLKFAEGQSIATRHAGVAHTGGERMKKTNEVSSKWNDRWFERSYALLQRLDKDLLKS